MSDISREELAAFTKAHSKSAVALDKITQTLEGIAIKQDKALDRIEHEVSDSIIEGVNNHYSSTHKDTISSLSRIEENQKTMKDSLTGALEKIPSTIDEKIKNSSISKDIEHVKWLVGIVGFVIIICTVIIRTAGNIHMDKTVVTQTAVLEELLKSHMEESERDNGKVK